jgi:hypothetical protein
MDEKSTTRATTESVSGHQDLPAGGLSGTLCNRLRGYDVVHFAAALAGQATVVATADGQRLAAAPRRPLDVSNPLEPCENP